MAELTSAKKTYQLYVGIDIASTSFEVACYQAEVSRGGKVERATHYEQTPTEYERLSQRLLKRVEQPQHILVVLEATSTYWINLALHLHQAGLVVSVVNPAQAHYFAKSELKKAKTDVLDAQLLTELALAQAAKLEGWNPPPQIYHELLQRLNYRQTLGQMAKSLKNQLHALSASRLAVEAVVELYKAQITDLEGQVEALDGELETVLKRDPAWAESVKLISTIPGIGPLSALYLVVVTLNFTTCTKAASLANYVGLAPSVKQSGTSIKGRGTLSPSSVPVVRTVLYMATISAARHNPALRAFYERLREKGKPFKVAILAVARKLLGVVLALKRTNLPFDSEIGLKAA